MQASNREIMSDAIRNNQSGTWKKCRKDEIIEIKYPDVNKITIKSRFPIREGTGIYYNYIL